MPGSAILCLILILTIRSRYYEIGVFLSLGQSKVKIILQQLFEMLLIAAVAFVISLGTGKLVSNVVGNMLESGTNNNQVQMQMPEIRDQNNDSNNTNSTSGNDKMFDQAFNGPENTELDVFNNYYSNAISGDYNCNLSCFNRYSICLCITIITT